MFVFNCLSDATDNAFQIKCLGNTQENGVILGLSAFFDDLGRATRVLSCFAQHRKEFIFTDGK